MSQRVSMGSKTTYFCDKCEKTLGSREATGLTLELQSHHPQGTPRFMRKRKKGYCSKCYGAQLVAICEAIDEIMGPDEEGDERAF
jgi:hypothetical protein